MDAIIDYRGKTPKKTVVGIPLVTAKIVKNGRIHPPTEFIAHEDYQGWMTRGFPERGDVVLTTEAPLGEVAQLHEANVALAQRIITLRGKTGVLDNTFLKFLLQHECVRSQLLGRASGSTVSGIKQSELRKIELPLPPLSTQRAIAKILGSLDDRIELCRQMNESLEAMARALFQDWFVEFGPVRAKMAGCEPAGLAQEISMLFSDRLDESELGEIPQGWRLGSLGDIASNQSRTVQPSEIDPDCPYIGLEHMPRRSITLSEWGCAVGLESNKLEFKHGEILFGKLRPYFHKVGVAPMDGVCSSDIVVIAPKSAGWYGLVLSHVSSDAFVEYTNAGSTGTKMPRTSWKEMSRYRIILPPKELAEAFTTLIRPQIMAILEGIVKMRTLSSLRDSLLPKLLSGELSIPEAMLQVEAAG